MKPLTLLLIILFLLAQQSTLYAGEIIVSAAISLKDAISCIADEFEKEHTDEKVLLNFASSGQLFKQIEQGAKVDLFISASNSEIDALEKQRLIFSSTNKVLARNSLVVITYNKINGVDDLLKPEYVNIAAGNPLTVPAGKYAKEALEFYDIYDKIKGKTVFAENVRQALDYVLRKEADAGIVYLTDALTAKDETLFVMKIDESSHSDITYIITTVAETKRKETAAMFIDFAASKKAQKILEHYGFLTPGN